MEEWEEEVSHVKLWFFSHGKFRQSYFEGEPAIDDGRSFVHVHKGFDYVAFRDFCRQFEHRVFARYRRVEGERYGEFCGLSVEASEVDRAWLTLAFY